MAFEPRKYEEIFEEMKSRSPAVSDFEVGSVARTLFESFSYELALLYEKMNRVYLSGFVDTAEGVHLEQVVAILGITRGLPDYATGTVAFIRDPGKEDITIPPGTLVATEETTDQPKKVYQTIEKKVLQKDDTAVSIRIQALVRGEEQVTAKESIIVMPRPVPGIKSVINPEALAFKGKRKENDDELRERAKSMLISSGKATTQTIENAVLALPGVKGVVIKEYQEEKLITGDSQNVDNKKVNVEGQPGVIHVQVDGLDMNEPKERQLVESAINEVKAAGIFVHVGNKVMTGINGVVGISLNPELTLSPAERTTLEEQVAQEIITFINELKNGQSLQFSKLIQKILAIENVEDVEDFELSTTGENAKTYSYSSSKRIEIDKNSSLGFDPNPKGNFLRVASEVKPLRVALEIKFNSQEPDVKSIDRINEKLKSYFKQFKEDHPPQMITSEDLIQAIEEDASIHVERDYFKLSVSPWCPSSVPKTNIVTRVISLQPSFMERIEQDAVFLYRDHLEITGAIRVGFPPEYRDDQKQQTIEAIREKLDNYLDRLPPEANLQFAELRKHLENDQTDWALEINPADFRAFKHRDDQWEEISSRIYKGELEIDPLEKASQRLIHGEPAIIIDEADHKLNVSVTCLDLELWLAYESVPPSYLKDPPDIKEDEGKVELKESDPLVIDIRAALKSKFVLEFIDTDVPYHQIDWESFFKAQIETVIPVKEYSAFLVESNGISTADNLVQTSKQVKSTFHIRSLEALEINPLRETNLKLKVYLLEKVKHKE